MVHGSSQTLVTNMSSVLHVSSDGRCALTSPSKHETAMKAVKKVHTKPEAPLLGEATPSLIAEVMEDGQLSNLRGLMDDLGQVKLIEECASKECVSLQGLKNEVELVAECAAEYRRNVSQMQNLMCSVPHLQDIMWNPSKGKLVEACTSEDCGNVSDLQGVLDDSDVELVEGCMAEDCGNVHDSQDITNRKIEVDLDTFHLQGSMDKLSEIKQVKEFSAEHWGCVSHSPGLTCNQKAQEVCSNVYDLHLIQDNPRKVDAVEMCAAENCHNVSDLPGLMDRLSNMDHAKECSAEDCDNMSGIQKAEPEEECMAQDDVVWQGFMSRSAYSLAEVAMDMNTVAVFLAQHALSSTDNKTDDMRQHMGPVEPNTGLCAPSSADNIAGSPSQHALPEEANTSLLASVLLPQMKILAKQYDKSRGSSLRRVLHEAKVMEFRGFGPDPAPDWIPPETFELLSKHGHIGCVEGSFNPLFDRMWLPWAQKAEFYHHQDVAMVCNQEILRTGLYCRSLATVCLSWAIPTRPILEYMVTKAPHGKIAEIGSGLGYWAALLKKLGADVVAVDDFSEKTSQCALYFPETIVMDGEDFIRQGGAHGRALFFCWPLKSCIQKLSWASAFRPIYKTCFAEACLNAFHGDTVFFIGEKDDGCTFDMAAWMQGNPKHRRSWMLEKKLDIPSWPGVHDVFMCFVKRKEASNFSFGKKKKKAVKKAQMVEGAHSLLSERFAKEEDFRKASFAAYPDCSMQ